MKINYVNPTNNSQGNQGNQQRMANPYQPNDFYSIMSTIQTALVTRQMEFQDWISNKFGIQNPTLKMLLCLIVMYPKQSYIRGKDLASQIYHLFFMIYMHIKSAVIRKPSPNRVEVIIPSIYENKLNNQYSPIEWYIKNNKQIKADTNTTILTASSDITTSTARNLSINYPCQSTNIIEYNGEEYSFSKTSEQITVSTVDGEMRKTNLVITIWSYYSTKEKLHEFIKYINELYALQKSTSTWKQHIYNNNGDNWEMKDNNKNFRKIESVVLSGGRCTTLKNDLMHFNTTEQWHLEHGIPYKKSYLFYGPPGTGKTSMIKAISNEFKRHIHLMSLNLIKDDKQLNLLVSKIHMNETIIVIEDIDAMTDVVYDRKERPKTPPPKENEKDKDKSNNNPGITLSGLLNVMDGISNNHGMILVMTSNIPEKLDKALLRPGRIDDKIYFDYCDNITIYNMMKNFYNGSVKQTDKEFSQIKFPEKIAPCKVENIMKKYWNDPEQALETLISGKETELETFTY
jgi:hypothetical protein